MLKFSKTSKKFFEARDICVWEETQESVGDIVDILEHESTGADSSTAKYRVIATCNNIKIFDLIWSTRDLPKKITGETAFRKMIDNLFLRRYSKTRHIVEPQFKGTVLDQERTNPTLK